MAREKKKENCGRFYCFHPGWFLELFESSGLGPYLNRTRSALKTSRAVWVPGSYHCADLEGFSCCTALLWRLRAPPCPTSGRTPSASLSPLQERQTKRMRGKAFRLLGQWWRGKNKKNGTALTLLKSRDELVHNVLHCSVMAGKEKHGWLWALSHPQMSNCRVIWCKIV